MRKGELNRLLSRAAQRWYRLRKPRAFVLRDKVDGRHIDLAVIYHRLDDDGAAPILTLYSAGGAEVGTIGLMAAEPADALTA